MEHYRYAFIPPPLVKGDGEDVEIGGSSLPRKFVLFDYDRKPPPNYNPKVVQGEKITKVTYLRWAPTPWNPITQGNLLVPFGLYLAYLCLNIH
jgi:hypothetical protein